VAADRVTPEAINFMVRNGCGILGLSLSPAICDRLHLDPLPGKNVDPQATPWTPHIDARTGITTGTSAADRARTVQIAIDDRTTPADLIVGKGHVPCLRAREGGVLVRAGHTEGSIDLARLAGFKESAVICEIVQPDGHMAHLPELREFCAAHSLKMCDQVGNIMPTDLQRPLEGNEMFVSKRRLCLVKDAVKFLDPSLARSPLVG
jgi:3,4-dihydroxy 2-butanone 4-phosphate synthase/GTP cyclohydrolase II